MYCDIAPYVWVTGYSRKPAYWEMRGFAGREKQPQSGALQTRSLHPRSHWSQYAAFPDMRISLTSWSSENYPNLLIYSTLSASIGATCVKTLHDIIRYTPNTAIV